jgi:xanthine/uracil permease
MRLFRAKSTYIYAFCGYAISALFLLSHGTRKSLPAEGGVLLLIVIPQVIGMSLLAAMAFSATRRTSSILEKCALILTGILCLLSVVSVFPKFGYDVPRSVISHSAFVTVTCAAAVVTGWRMLQIVTGKGNEQ